MAFDPDQYLAKKTAFDPDKFLAKRMANVQVKDEMPEWVADADRLKAKNLTNNVDEQVAFLQKQYPDADVMKQGDKVLLRKKGDTEYGVLDPSFSLGRMFSKEGLRDAGDIIGDVVQGGAEAVGAAAGAAGGLPGVMAGSGVASGVASSAKEKLAEMLGVKEADYMNAGKDALLGAALPGVFAGAGKGIKYGAQKVAPKLYAKATGLTTEALKRIADKGDSFAQMDEVGAEGILRGAKHDVDKFISGKKADFSNQYKTLRGLNSDVDMGDVVKLIDDEIAQASAQAARNPGTNAFKDQVDELLKMREDIFSQNISPTKMDIGDAIDLDGRISDKYIDWTPDTAQGVGSGNTISAQQERLARALRERLRDSVDNGAVGLKKGVDGDYHKFVEEVNFLKKNFKDPKKIQSTFEALGKGKDISLAGGFQRIDQKLLNQLNQAKGDVDLYRYFRPTNSSILTEKGLVDMATGKAPIEKLLTAIGTGAGYVAQGPVGGVIGAGVGRGAGKMVASPGAVKRVAKGGKKLGQGIEALQKYLEENPEMMRLLYGASAAATQD